MNTEVALTGLEFHVKSGYYDEEQLIGNRFEVDVFVGIKNIKGDSENLEHTVDYEKLYAVVKKHMREPFKLIETPGLKILAELKHTFPKVWHSKVVIRKYHPPIGGVSNYAQIVLED